MVILHSSTGGCHKYLKMDARGIDRRDGRPHSGERLVRLPDGLSENAQRGSHDALASDVGLYVRESCVDAWRSREEDVREATGL